MTRSISWQAIDFIVEALAANTYGDDRTKVGIYLVGLVMKDRKKPMEPEQAEMVKRLLAEASDIRNEC
ncbi:hypothetical protein [Photobacterium galatheae]|uniref:Uncharacterized protein n=1 Tax=Photobacterium galatheae TaxID=1654360 RepID=A0A066RPY4_9GAMM|nr:hypothetical protein [Photobacterium galatheae]KDM89712.1 hypothetical protein EA58_21130 [Photobacterium galatheae]MCM0151536.1 hypothetical protein [Photobacterium galatheae]